MTDSEPKSWADMVRSRDLERKKLPWDPSTVEPVKRVNLAERKLKERELDPVLMEFRDAKREDIIKDRFNQTMSAAKTRAETLKSTRFNIISHEGPPRQIELNPKVTKKAPPRDWNLVSHLPLDIHESAPTQFNEEFHQNFARPNIQSHPIREISKREFDIINNQFSSDHEARNKADYERIKQYTTQKYWATHDFNPIVGEYYDLDKEIQYQDNFKLAETLQGSAQLQRIPPEILYSEGYCYNILNNQVTNPDRFQVTSSTKDRSLHRMKKLQIEAGMKDYGELKKIQQDSRRINRVVYERWRTSLDRGYDFVTNLPQQQYDPRSFNGNNDLYDSRVAAATLTNPLASSMERENFESSMDQCSIQCSFSNPKCCKNFTQQAGLTDANGQKTLSSKKDTFNRRDYEPSSIEAHKIAVPFPSRPKSVWSRLQHPVPSLSESQVRGNTAFPDSPSQYSLSSSERAASAMPSIRLGSGNNNNNSSSSSSSSNNQSGHCSGGICSIGSGRAGNSHISSGSHNNDPQSLVRSTSLGSSSAINVPALPLSRSGISSAGLPRQQMVRTGGF